MTVFKLIISVSLFIPSILTLTNPTDEYPELDRPTSLEHEENSCLGLNYHRVRDFGFIENIFQFLSSNRELNTYSVSTEAFDSHMEFLRQEVNANFVTMDELLDYYDSGEFPERCVWINFDDMDTSIYENAHPILEEYDIPATGFVITGEVGNEDFNNISLLEQERLNEMEDSGVWEFSTHTHELHHLDNNTARILSVDDAEVDTDTEASLNYFETEFSDSNVETIAYPFGQADDDTIEVMEENGIEYGFSLEEKEIRTDSNPYFIPRVLVSEDAFETLIVDWEGFN